MKMLCLLINMRFRSLLGSLFRGKRDASGRYRSKGPIMLTFGVLLLLFLFCVFAFMFGGILLAIAGVLYVTELDFSFFYALSGAATFLLSVVGSVTITQSELYNAKDNEFLLSMPIPPSLIMLSRTVYLLLWNFIFGGAIALPALVVHLIFVGGVGATLVFALALFIIPFVSLAFSCILGWLLSLLISRMRHKNFLTLVATLLVLGVYFAFCFNVDSIFVYIEESLAEMVAVLAPFFGPFNWLGEAVVSGNVLSGALFFLICFAVVVFAYLFVSHTYVGILTSKRGEVKRVYREKKEKAKSPTVSLVFREIRQFLSAPFYIVNEGLGLFFALAVGILFLLNGGELIRSLAEDPDIGEVTSVLILPVLPALLASALCFLGGMCVISAPSLSIEGKNLWILQSLPVRGGDVLCAKAYAHIVITFPFFTVASLLVTVGMAAAMPIGFFDVLAIFLLPFSFNCLTAFIGIALNFAFPRFDYPTLAAAVKSGASVILTMFGMMIVASLVGVVAFNFIAFSSIATVVLALVFLGICLLLRTYFYGSSAEKRFSRLGQ